MVCFHLIFLTLNFSIDHLAAWRTKLYPTLHIALLFALRTHAILWSLQAELDAQASIDICTHRAINTWHQASWSYLRKN